MAKGAGTMIEMGKGARNRAARRAKREQEDGQPAQPPRYDNIALRRIRVINAPRGSVGADFTGESAKDLTFEDIDMDGGASVVRVDTDEIENVQARRIRHRQGPP